MSHKTIIIYRNEKAWAILSGDSVTVDLNIKAALKPYAWLEVPEKPFGGIAKCPSYDAAAVTIVPEDPKPEATPAA